MIDVGENAFSVRVGSIRNEGMSIFGLKKMHLKNQGNLYVLWLFKNK